jgi:O-antigen/teichoic acid export membrane protein
MLFKSVLGREQVKKFLPLAAQAGTRLGASFVTVKVITAFLAPAQFIVYGQLQTLMQVYSAIATSVASTKFSALIAKSDSEHDKSRIVDTAVYLILALAAVLLGVALVFNQQIQAFISVEGRNLEVMALPIGAFAVAYSTLLQAYFTGVGDAYRFSRNSVVSILFVTASTIGMTAGFGFLGALFSVGVAPIIACAVVTLMDNPFKKPSFRNVDLATGGKITGFTVASIVTLVGYYCAQLYVRAHYAQEVSAHQAGLLNATSRISDVYMGVLAVGYANVLTKAFGSIQHAERLRHIGRSYLVFGLVGLPGFLLLALSGEVWVPLVLSHQYWEASDHMAMQMGGDALKCLYWISLYYVISKHSSFVYFALEFGGLAIYVLAAIYNPFGSAKFSPQIAQIIEYSVLLVAVNAVVVLNRHE